MVVSRTQNHNRVSHHRPKHLHLVINQVTENRRKGDEDLGKSLKRMKLTAGRRKANKGDLEDVFTIWKVSSMCLRSSFKKEKNDDQRAFSNRDCSLSVDQLANEC